MFRNLLAAALVLTATPLAAETITVASADGAQGLPQAVGAEFMVMEVSTSEEARGHFLRGLALLHNFEYTFAADEFRLAQEADPDFVMAYWGEAMTHNHPLWAEQDRDAALEILGRLGATPAARAAKARSEKERQWLASVETLYGTSGELGSKVERDLAYLSALEAMLVAYPEDIDVRAFTGLATLGSSHGGRQIPIYMRAAGILEPGFMTHQNHPGILHYLIHSYDDPVHAPLGERMAERYAVIAPDAAHAQHMISHIYLALADWPATELANVNAAKVVNLQRGAQGLDPTFCGHYNEWLAYALLQQGKDAATMTKKCVEQVREGAAEAIASGESGVRGSWSAAGMAMFLGLETGTWLDPIRFPETNQTAAARFVQSHADILRYHASDGAKAAAALETMEAIFVVYSEREAADGRTASDSWSARQLEQARALVKMSQGDHRAGLAALTEAAAVELAMPIVFGPPAIFKPSYEILGEIYLEQGRLEDAAAAFEKALRLAPGRRLSLAGLEVARAP